MSLGSSVLLDDKKMQTLTWGADKVQCIRILKFYPGNNHENENVANPHLSGENICEPRIWVKFILIMGQTSTVFHLTTFVFITKLH